MTQTERHKAKMERKRQERAQRALLVTGVRRASYNPDDLRVIRIRNGVGHPVRSIR